MSAHHRQRVSSSKTWPCGLLLFFPVPTVPSVLVSLSLMIVAAAQALNAPPPRQSGPASASSPASWQQLGHVWNSYPALAWAVIRRKFQRILRGQLGLVDMVQLIALCSIIQAITLWRKRCLIRKEELEISDAGQEHRVAAGIRPSSQLSARRSKLGTFSMAHTLAIDNCSSKNCPRAIQRRIDRSWSIEKAFQLQVLYHLLRDLSFHPYLLSTTSASR